MSRYRIEPKSRKDLRAIALRIREAFGLRDCLYFPIVDFMEHMMPKMFDNYNWEIIDDDELPTNQDAVTVIENGFGTVRIKQSVYDGACDGDGQHRMTIAHEVVGHFIPMCVLGFEFYRSYGDEEIEAYRDPEWHAKCLAGEFMMAYHLVGEDKPKQLMEKCGVSQSAARYQRKKFREEAKKEEERKRLFQIK